MFTDAEEKVRLADILWFDPRKNSGTCADAIAFSARTTAHMECPFRQLGS
jgi:hypothetical protein